MVILPLTEGRRLCPPSNCSSAVVTCEIKLFQNYFSLCGRPPEIILFQRVETWLELFLKN